MKENLLFPFSKEEILLAMSFVTDVIANATKSNMPDEDGIFIDTNSFIKYINYYNAKKLITMISKFQQYDIYKGLDEKVLDWITE